MRKFCSLYLATSVLVRYASLTHPTKLKIDPKLDFLKIYRLLNMSVHSLLNTLSQQGIKLSFNQDSLLIDAPKGALTTELRQSLTEHKIALLDLLRQYSLDGKVNQLPAITPAPELRHEPFPLTDMQHAFWVGRSGILDLGNVSNHGYYEIEGENLNLERLNQTLQILIQRHEMLRAVVLPDGRQQVLSEVPAYQIKVLDLRGKSEIEIASQLAEVRDVLSHQVLPADKWPLFEFRVTFLNDHKFRLHVSYDLLVFDAWSLFRLFEEWFQLYQNLEAILPPLEISFRDYVLAEQAILSTELYQRSQQYWLDRIDTLPPPPDLPLAKSPKELQAHRCQRYSGQMEAELWQLLKGKAADWGLTPAGLLLAAFAEVLTLWSSSPEFTINLALFNRLPLHPQVNNILGDFTSVTLLAVDNSRSESFGDRAMRLQKQLWQDLEHRYFSGVRVTREITRRQGTLPNAMPVIFTSTLGFAAMGQKTLTFSHFGELVYGISQASQAWMDIQVWEEKEALTFNWDVVAELFPAGLIADMFDAYCRFLNQLAIRDPSWLETTRQLLPPSQWEQRNIINATDAPISDALLHQLFLEQVAKSPAQIAVVAANYRLTYQELSDRAHQVAHRLRRLGIGKNTLVGITMEKGWEQVVAVMGILIAGAAYLPIDPNLGSERFQYLLQHSQVEIVLTQSWLKSQLSGSQFLAVDQDDFADESREAINSIQTADDLAYSIYTSGSTGLPKGVMITHRNAVNMVIYTNQRFQIGAGDRLLALTALHHDLSVYDIFGLLSAGGTIVMPDAAKIKDPNSWLELLHREKITLWNSVPAMMEMLLNIGEDRENQLASSWLRLAILGGDWLPISLAQRLKKAMPNLQLLSIGGPTETTVWNIGYLVSEIEPTWKSIPYGKPMPNSKYYILNQAGQDCPTWVVGEMYCAGIQLAQGYWRDEEKTAANFIIHPQTQERLYRSGDLGRYLPDGNIEFVGRVDFQIKLRGYRIEVGEIEAVLMQHPGVKAAIVKAVGEQAQRYLAAYIIPTGKLLPTVEELHQFVRRKLPDYMVPSALLFLDNFPLSANGKVDRQALPIRAENFQKLEVVYTPPSNQIEQAIAAVFQEELELPKVGINDNFFDLGANSLLITNIYRKLRGVIPESMAEVALIDLFSYPTVKALAQRLSQSQKTSFVAPDMGVEEKLNQGKNRLKQRWEKSKFSRRSP